jgi:hypothetical protein
MKTFLEEQIAASQERLAALDAERSIVSAELAAYQKMLERFTAEIGGSSATKGQTTDSKNRMGRGLSREWLSILSELSKHSKFFTSRDVERTAQKLEIKQNGVNIRSQLSNYTEKGVVRRIGLGRYVVTDATKEVLDPPRKLLKNAVDSLGVRPDPQTNWDQSW